MATFNATVITNAGEALISQVVAGETGPIQFTKVVLSSNQYPTGTDYKTLTDLIGIQLTVPPSNIVRVNATTFYVQGVFTNETVTAAFSIWNIGVYCNNSSGTEILFSVTPSQSPADTMPTNTSTASFIAKPEYLVSDEVDISVLVDPAGLVTVDMLNDYIPKAWMAVAGTSEHDGVATLDTTGKVPLVQLPDDIGGSDVNGWQFFDGSEDIFDSINWNTVTLTRVGQLLPEKSYFFKNLTNEINLFPPGQYEQNTLGSLLIIKGSADFGFIQYINDYEAYAVDPAFYYSYYHTGEAAPWTNTVPDITVEWDGGLVSLQDFADAVDARFEELKDEIQNIDVDVIKYATSVIGSSTAGYTSAEVDYLCNGINDQDTFNEAIQNLPATGGKLVVLDGTYIFDSWLTIRKNNITIEGCGMNNTIISRNFGGSDPGNSQVNWIAVINIFANDIIVKDLWIKVNYYDENIFPNQSSYVTGIRTNGDNLIFNKLKFSDYISAIWFTTLGVGQDPVAANGVFITPGKDYMNNIMVNECVFYEDQVAGANRYGSNRNPQAVGYTNGFYGKSTNFIVSNNIINHGSSINFYPSIYAGIIDECYIKNVVIIGNSISRDPTQLSQNHAINIGSGLFKVNDEFTTQAISITGNSIRDIKSSPNTGSNLTASAIYLYGCFGVSVSGNSISGCSTGIAILPPGSSNGAGATTTCNIITGNYISGAVYGVVTRTTSTQPVEDNQFSNNIIQNSTYGVNIIGASSRRNVFKNNIIKNCINPFNDNGTDNVNEGNIIVS